MFFKKKVVVADYCYGKLQMLKLPETVAFWGGLKDLSDDPVFRDTSSERVAEQLFAAHIQLLSMSINKQYRDINLHAAVHGCVQSFIAQHFQPSMETLVRMYNSAFGSSPTDGVLAMVHLLDMTVADGRLNDKTRAMLYDVMYAFVSARFADFKGIKLVVS
jgi:hypothetical protein